MGRRKETLWRKILDASVEEITGGGYKLGDRFHSSEDICRRFKVSKITSLRVLGELERMNLISKERGRGNYVRRAGLKTSIKLLVHVPPQARPPYIFPILFRYQAGIQAAAASRSVPVEIVEASYLDNPESDRELLIGFGYGEKDDEEIFDVLRGGGHHCVFLHLLNPVPGISTVRSDYRGGVRLTTEHLIAKGHRRIAFLSKPINSGWHAPRFDGYHEALRRAGLFLDTRLVKELPDADSSGVGAAMDELLALPEPPTAVAASSDMIALSVLRYCAERGVAVPSRLAVTGLDNRKEAEVSSPALTTADPLYEMQGRMAVDTLLEIRADESLKSRDIVLSPKFIERAST